MAATHLEDRTVSRKTPGDGQLEITRPAAQRLAVVGRSFALKTPAGSGTAELRTLPCTCRGADNPHEHWFLVSSLFRTLVPGATISISLDRGTIVVEGLG
jgi:hypothetical protein